MIKYFISVSVWVHWALYCDFKKKFSSFTTQSLSLRHHCYNRSRCSGRENHPNSQVLYCQLRPMKSDSGMVECVFYVSMHIKKILGILPTICECDQPTAYILHLTQLLAGRVVRVDTGCAAGASSSIWWDDK